MGVGPNGLCRWVPFQFRIFDIYGGLLQYIGSNRKAPKGGGLREKMEPGSAWGTLQKHEVQQAHVAASKIPLDIRRKHPWGGQNHSPRGVEILETQLDTTPYLTLKLALP